MPSINEMFDFTVRIGYGKVLCQFLDSVDAANLEMVNTQCREIIPIHRKRWGFKPGFSENMWRHITIFFGDQIHKTPFQVYNCKYYKCRKGNVISFRGNQFGQILDIIIPNDDLWIELITIWEEFNEFKNKCLRYTKHEINLKIYKNEQERLKKLKIKEDEKLKKLKIIEDEKRRQEELKRICKVTNPWSKPRL